MSPTATPLIITREYTPDDEAGVLSLMKKALGETSTRQRTTDAWRWKHTDNVFGPSYIRIAINEESGPVGLRAFMQWQFLMCGRTVKAAQAVDTATHPEYRRRGIFTTLTGHVVEDSRLDGVELIFNTPNLIARPGYLKMGWQLAGTIQPLILVLNPVRFFWKLGRKVIRRQSTANHNSRGFFRTPLPEASTLLEHTEAMEELFSRDQQMHGTGSIRTPLSTDYLRWRYTKHPDLTYHTVFERAGNRITACGIVRAGSRLGLREVILSDLWLSEPEERLAKGILEQVKSASRGDYILAYAQEGTFLRQTLRALGFRALPQMAMNQRIERMFLGVQKPRRLAVRPLNQDLPVDPLALKNWALSLGDLEIF